MSTLIDKVHYNSHPCAFVLCCRAFSTNDKKQDIPDAESALPLPFLPEAVLTAILQHVPLQQRLSSWALVCHAWKAAAAQTTADIGLSVPQDLSTDSFQHLHSWLQRNWCRVASIGLQHCPSTQASWSHWQAITLQLPTAKLTQMQTLDLQGMQVSLHRQQNTASTRSKKRGRSNSSNGAADSSSIPAAPAGQLMPQLRSLRLHACKIPINSFMQLTQLCSLTALSVVKPVVTTSQDFYSAARADRTETAMSKILQQLTSLETLELSGFNEGGSGVLSHELLSPISTMQHLQSLSVELGPYWPHSLAFLPTTLTALYLSGDLTLSPLTAPQLSQISSLQSLELIATTDPGNDCGTNLDPAALYSCPNLTRLCLDGIGITPTAGDVSLQGGRVLKPLGCLTQLRHVQFSQWSELEPADEDANLEFNSDSHMEGEEDSDPDLDSAELDSADGSDWEDEGAEGPAFAQPVRYPIEPSYFTSSSQLTALEFNDGLPCSMLGQLFDRRRLPQLAYSG
jgi:hypothetical protein